MSLIKHLAVALAIIVIIGGVCEARSSRAIPQNDDGTLCFSLMYNGVIHQYKAVGLMPGATHEEKKRVVDTYLMQSRRAIDAGAGSMSIDLARRVCEDCYSAPPTAIEYPGGYWHGCYPCIGNECKVYCWQSPGWPCPKPCKN